MRKVKIGMLPEKEKMQTGQKEPFVALLGIPDERALKIAEEMAVAHDFFKDWDDGFSASEYLAKMLPLGNTAEEQILIGYMSGRRLEELTNESGNIINVLSNLAALRKSVKKLEKGE